ncbi:hypothetical protein CRE_12719 [Caenorhabditis remanei]|uniref:Uncharacterized protein n=1 Tax=Caenorhabditis remanei TaxID=31234 RepID=E3M7F0_CAERE|nr:hypothetical protein CRE_12719 [Caenorhabditis remanei]
MGKNKKNSSSLQTPWKKIEVDFSGEKSLINGADVFEEIDVQELESKILHPLLKSGASFEAVLSRIIEWKGYLQPRSQCLYSELDSKIKEEFEHIRVTLPQPFDEYQWQELVTITEIDLNKTPISINGIPTSTITICNSLRILLKDLNVNVRSVEVFPFEVDSFGLPPINCKKIWNPLIWLRLEIEKKIKEFCQNDLPIINQLVTSLDLAPKEGYFEKLAVTSFFLEKTADNLDYSKSGNKDKFMSDLQMMFGTTKVDELTMVLPDILMAYSEELVERVMQVSYFIPFELFRLMFLCWQPKVLRLRLRSEACFSIEDAARIEWDDEDVFTSTTLFNCPLFDRCEPVSLGDESEILECSLIVETTGSRLFDPIYNEKNFDTVGRDFLILFPMHTILIKKTVTLKSGASVKTQLKQQIDFIVNTFFCNAEEHQERVVHYELVFANSREVQMSVVRKCIPQTANKRKIGVNYNVEQDTKSLFNKYGSSQEGKYLFVSFFDSENQVIVDVKIILTS